MLHPLTLNMSIHAKLGQYNADTFARPAAAVVLTLQDRYVLVWHERRFLTTCAISLLINGINCECIYALLQNHLAHVG